MPAAARSPRSDPVHLALPHLLQIALGQQRQRLASQLNEILPHLKGLGRQEQRTLDQLRDSLALAQPGQAAAPTTLLGQTLGQIQDGSFPVREPRHGLDAVALPDEVRQAIDMMVHEHQRADHLAKFALAPRHRVLLHGAPGNGKTMLAEALAHALGIPFVAVNYAHLINSHMGATSKALDTLFLTARAAPVVLFLDEIDTVGATRGHPMEVGEMRRVLNHLMVQIERLPEHVVLVGATNLVDQLDPALRRRFELVLELPRPTDETVRACALRELDPAKTPGHDLTSQVDALIARQPANLSEVVNLCRAMRRDLALHDGQHIELLVSSFTPSMPSPKDAA